MGRWQFHIETAVSSLGTNLVPLNQYYMWNRLIDDLEEPDSNTDRLEQGPPQDLSWTVLQDL